MENSSQEVRAEKLAELLAIIKGKIVEVRKKKKPLLIFTSFSYVMFIFYQICLKHDASRIVQTCVKYGNAEQRDLIAQELKGKEEK